MKSAAFDRKKHVYTNVDFVELVKDAVRFFNGTPVHPLPPPEVFAGTGVYAQWSIRTSQVGLGRGARRSQLGKKVQWQTKRQG